MKARTAIAAAVVTVGAAAAIAYVVALRMAEPLQEPAMVDIYFAICDMPAGTCLHNPEEAFSVLSIPRGAEPPGAIKDLEDLRNKRLKIKLSPEEACAQHHLEPLPEVGADRVTVPVRIRFDSMSGAFIRLDCRIILYCVSSRPTGPQCQRIATRAFVLGFVTTPTDRDTVEGRPTLLLSVTADEASLLAATMKEEKDSYFIVQLLRHD